MEENICNRCVKQSVCKNYIKGQNIVGCIEFLSIKRTDYLTDDELLDKIRTEIIEACGYSKDYVGDFNYTTTCLKIVLQIIDKYRTRK